MAEVSQRKRVWGWFFFDWASQPYHTLLVTFIFGPFFAAVATQVFMETGLAEDAADAAAQSLWANAMTYIGITIGICAPILGAMADTNGRKRPWMLAFSAMVVIGAGGLWFMDPLGSNLFLMLALFGFGFIGAEFALVFVNSQLPELSADEDAGKLSGSGFAFGYLGGLIALILMLLFFVEQSSGVTVIGLGLPFGLDADAREGTRLAGPFVALWYAVFMIPFFMWVKDRPVSGAGRSVGEALGSVWTAIKRLKSRGSLARFLLSSMLFRDALNGLYMFGGVYATLVLNWEITQVGIFGIVGAASAAVFSWIGGQLDHRFGPRPVIFGAILVLVGVCLVVVNMSRETLFGVALAEGSGLPDAIFFGCGALIGGMGGILQAASRTLMVRHTDLANPTESFGLYGLSGRATAFIAPALIGLVTDATGSARLGVSPLIALFLMGFVILIWVRPEGDQT